MKPLKILILSYRSAPFGGGQGIYVKELSESLANLGHHVEVFSGPPYPQLNQNIKLIKSEGLNLFETFNFKDRLSKLFKKQKKTLGDYYEFFSVLAGGFPEMKTFGSRAEKYVTNMNYDVVIDNQSLSYGILNIQNKFPLIEVIHHPITKDLEHELETNNGLIYRFSRKRWYSFLKMQKAVAPKISFILSPSLSSKKDISKDFDVDLKNITVIQNAIDTNTFKPYPDNIRMPYRIITTASADVPLKGLDYSIYAISKIQKKIKDIELVVIGSPRAGGHTERLIKKLKLEDKIKFITNLTKEEIAIEYSKSSVAIVSSLYEGFGYPVAEAMSCQIPLIATNISSIPEITGEYATLIEPRSAKMIEDSLNDIFLNYEKHQQIAIKGREHIIRNLSWQTIGKKYQDLIKIVINNHNTKKC